MSAWQRPKQCVAPPEAAALALDADSTTYCQVETPDGIPRLEMR